MQQPVIHYIHYTIFSIFIPLRAMGSPLCSLENVKLTVDLSQDFNQLTYFWGKNQCKSIFLQDVEFS